MDKIRQQIQKIIDDIKALNGMYKDADIQQVDCGGYAKWADVQLNRLEEQLKRLDKWHSTYMEQIKAECEKITGDNIQEYPRESNTSPFKPCIGCKSYYVTPSEKEGLIKANCLKWGMSTEIKEGKILFCPADKAERG